MPRSSSRLRAARPDRLLRVLVALSACASGCHCGGTALKVQDQTSVVIRTPADGSDGAPGSAVTFTAHAENPAGLLLLRLRAGQAEVGSCAAVAAGATALDCAATVLPKDHQADFANGLLRFTAVATAASGDSAQATADLVVSPDATVLAIDAPQAGTTRAPADAVVFKAHATNLAHLATLTLSAGADLLATCAPDPRNLTRIDCQATLTLQAHAAQLSGGTLVLSAVSTSAGGSALTKTVSVAQSQPPPPAWGVSF